MSNIEIRKYIKIILPLAAFFALFHGISRDFSLYISKHNTEYFSTPNGLLIVPVSLQEPHDKKYFTEHVKEPQKYFYWESWMYAATPFFAAILLFFMTGAFIYFFARMRRLEKSFLILIYYLSILYLLFLDYITGAKHETLFYVLLSGMSVPFVYFFRAIYGYATRGAFYYVTLPLIIFLPVLFEPQDKTDEINMFQAIGLTYLITTLYCAYLFFRDIENPGNQSYIKPDWAKNLFAGIALSLPALFTFYFLIMPALKTKAHVGMNTLFFLPSLIPTSFFLLSLRFRFVYFETAFYSWFLRIFYFLFFSFLYWFSIGFHLGDTILFEEKRLLHILTAVIFLLIIDPIKTLFYIFYNRHFILHRQELTKFAAKISDYAVNPNQIESFLEKYTSTLRESLDIEKVRFVMSENLFENRGRPEDTIIFIKDLDPIWSYLKLWRKARTYPVFTTRAFGPIRDLLQENGAFLFMPFRNFKAGILLNAKTSGKSFYSEDIHFLKRILKLTEPLLENYQFLIANAKLKRQEKELELAFRIQEKLIPSAHRDNNLVFQSYFRGSRKVTGDYVDFMHLGKNRYFLFLGDVSGHGLGSAYITAIVRSIIRSSITELKSELVDIFNSLNNFLIHKYKGNNILTLTGIEIEIKKTQNKNNYLLKYINAGCHAPLIYAKTNKTYSRFKNIQRVLGAAKTNYISESLTLKNPAKILLYSDGAFEIFNSQNKMAGEKQLIKWIKKSILLTPEDQIEYLTKKIFSYGEDNRHDYDDISFAVLDLI
ncbi:MAG: SpoIIE family protein phosphatase [Spirochaetia bacterium]|nr:SpoIIE family protein phosphatase [Spirochaetia bacterium]